MNEIRATIEEDIFPLSLNLRSADKDEIYASTGKRLYHHTLLESWKESKVCYTWLLDGEPIFIFGAVDNVNGGVVWAMGSDKMIGERKYFLENAPKFIEEFLNEYGNIFNYVYIENKVHINWLRRVGFVFHDEPVKLKNGEEFLYFYKIKE